jgi:hypothetical protein
MPCKTVTNERIEQGETLGTARSNRTKRARPRAAWAERWGRSAQARLAGGRPGPPGRPWGPRWQARSVGAARARLMGDQDIGSWCRVKVMGRASWAARPGSRRVAQTYSTPLASDRRSAAAGSAPTLAQNPSRALLGASSAPNAACRQGIHRLGLRPNAPHRAHAYHPCLIVYHVKAGEHLPRPVRSPEYGGDGAGLGGRPAHGLRHVRLARGDARHGHRQPPRRAVHGHRAVRQPQPRQQRRHALPAARPRRLGARTHGNVRTAQWQS